MCTQCDKATTIAEILRDEAMPIETASNLLGAFLPDDVRDELLIVVTKWKELQLECGEMLEMLAAS